MSIILKPTLQFQLSPIVIILFVLAIVIFFNIVSKGYKKEIKTLKNIDSITERWNINRFKLEAIELLTVSKNLSYALVTIDISKFRYIIESYGRIFGDQLLKQVANSFVELLPENSISARNSADDFIILLPYQKATEIPDYLKSFYKNIEYCTIDNITVRLTFDSGIYLPVQYNEDISNAIDKAEIARKLAKGINGNHLAFFNEEIQKNYLREKEIEESMERALSDNEFMVFYQPKYDIIKEKIVGAEALVRWNSKTSGFLLPDDFIPIFEKNDFIIELDFYVLEEACKMIRFWIDHKFEVVPISVNQSRNHLRINDYIYRLNTLMKKYQIPKTLIELELTESTFLELNNAAKVMNDMKELGFLVSMDDFGSGYSSLNMLNQISIDTLKIDKCFLNEKVISERTKIIIDQIVEMADRLKMEVICEGVETIEQVEFLKSIGCNYAQGYYYAKPMPVEEFRLKYEKAL